MELEFGKHFKDATNLLLMMDHDSGYIEGSENCIIHDSFKDHTRVYDEPDNFYLNEDALLEKPEVFINLDKPKNLLNNEGAHHIYSPESFLESSVKSEDSTNRYSGLESNSEPSVEIPLQDPIVVKCQDLSQMDNSSANQYSKTDTTLGCTTYNPVLIEKYNTASTDSINNMTPLKGFPLISVKTQGPCSSAKSESNENKLMDSKDKKKLTLVFSKSKNENHYECKRKYPSITPEKKIDIPITATISPDIFGDEEVRSDEAVNNTTNYFETQTLEQCKLSIQTKNDEIYVDKLDHKLLKRVQKGMSGVLPPPSVTIINMSSAEMLERIQANKDYFWNSDAVIEKVDCENNESSLSSSSDSRSCSKSLLLNIESSTDLDNAQFTQLLKYRYHGLHHNRSRVSEEIESMCEKYQKRFVGAETQSTCTVFELQVSSPTKRKMTKPRWGGKSPGRRLSHLARRRITFSSANLQTGGSRLAGSRARQILVDARQMELLNRRRSPRKSPRKTPKKTPRKSPKTKARTPSSSAKKKLAMKFRKLTGEFETSVPSTSETSFTFSKTTSSENNKGNTMSLKRALFQSPNRDRNSSLTTNYPQGVLNSTEKSKLRRVLFSSPKKSSPLKVKKSPFKQMGMEKKRKRSESDDVPPAKFPRSVSMDVRAVSSGSRSFFKPQSELNASLTRSQSNYELTDTHKKKLQWAVYGALQLNNITKDHPQWKIFAAVLGRVVRYFFTHQVAASMAVGAKLEGGTTERMNRIAKYHILSVIKGKSADEIIAEYLKSRPRVNKPQGYVAPEEYNNMKKKITPAVKDGILQDRVNTIESWEKSRAQRMLKPTLTENRIERIRKVINFGDDR